VKYVTFLPEKTGQFCYVCGELTMKAQVKPLSPLLRKAYELYFGCKFGDQVKFGLQKFAAAHVRGH
jgi:hypothetical protein